MRIAAAKRATPNFAHCISVALGLFVVATLLVSVRVAAIEAYL
jgi:hypothetical protein